LRLIIFAILVFHLHVASAATMTGRVVRVIDGDTIILLGQGNVQHIIRLKSIDAPEQGQPYEAMAMDNLSRHTAGKFVVVDYDNKDRDGRIVGRVQVGDIDVCLQQISDGLAWHYQSDEQTQSLSEQMCYSNSEKEARKNRRGLWYDPSPIPPWQWRRGRPAQ
jgi:endonuclease YncB( thermonuclease family)